MKKWVIAPLAVLLVALPFLSACDLFGGGDSEREYYEQQLEAYKKVAEANRKAQEEYNKNLREGLQQWSEEYKKWQDQKLQQEVDAANQALEEQEQ
ncbi:MAG: hypothetical protein JXA51_04210 [Dehalococcoidales bacterium]|jgi:hypothetical protein|nr:hypothetical protein [Dehalococcoidales bacterium]